MRFLERHQPDGVEFLAENDRLAFENMQMKNAAHRRVVNRNQSRVPEESTLYSKVIPILLVGMAVLMVVLVLFALGIITGIIPFQ